uniref:Xylulose kinase n=1 Tax=Syphacia muris TaxID=451379 RepID=A0A0N5AGM5_9BILA
MVSEVGEVFINEDGDISEQHLENGVKKHKDGVTVTAPVFMWLEAIDLIFAKLSRVVSLSSVKSISGCGQQHGTVYWNRKASSFLSCLDFKKSLKQNLQDAFSTTDSPIWMDSSTSEECELMELRVGGAWELCATTGSRAFHRFSGNQIMKIYRKKREVFDDTDRISLVSSFVASVLCGKFVDIDLGDACGMNLLDVRLKRWSAKCLNAVVDGEVSSCNALLEKLGTPVASNSVVGTVSEYFYKKYGLSSSCEVVAFTGDNLSSLAGLCLQPGDVAISLGTSDTVLFASKDYAYALEGHFFRNSVNPDDYMGYLLFSFKNGSLTRDRIRRSVNAANWDEFTALVKQAPVGNGGNIGFYFDDNEIIPRIKRSDYRFDSSKNPVAKFSRATEARAVLEHQSLAKRLHAENLGNTFKHRGKILITGGASSNKIIAQMLADVFNSDVFTIESADSAALGGALRARSVSSYYNADYFSISSSAVKKRCVASPVKENVEVYNKQLIEYAKLEEIITRDALVF